MIKGSGKSNLLRGITIQGKEQRLANWMGLGIQSGLLYLLAVQI